VKERIALWLALHFSGERDIKARIRMTILVIVIQALITVPPWFMYDIPGQGRAVEYIFRMGLITFVYLAVIWGVSAA